MTTRRHQLIGAEVSYYSGKVRAYLRYKRVPFEEIAATRGSTATSSCPGRGWPSFPS